MPTGTTVKTTPRNQKSVVMVVDDDFSARMQLSFTLENAGHGVVEAASGQEALDLFEKTPPNLILLDIVMPEMDGFDTCRMLRSLPGGVHTPVVMITSMEDTETITQAFDAGATDFISKPINMLILGYRVLYWLRSGSALSELKTNQKQLNRAQEIARLGHWKRNLETGEFLVTCHKPEILGLTRLGTYDDLFANIVSDEKVTARKLIDEACEKKTAFSVHYEVSLQDGSKRIILNQGEVITEDIQQQRLAVGIVQDITEMKQAEAQILRSKKKLQAVFDGISEPLVMMDRNLIIQMVNLEATRYFQVASPQDIIGKSLCGNDSNRRKQCDKCPIPAAIFKEMKLTFSREGFMDPERVELVTLFPLRAENEEEAGAVIRISDITEAKMIEKSLLRTEKLASIGVLSSGVAHEINNPNNFIMFNIPILRRYLGAILPVVKEHSASLSESSLFGMSFEEFEKDLFDLTDSIEKGSERIKSIVAELKDFSSLGDKEEMEWKSPEQTIEQAVRISSVQLKNKVKHFEIDIPKDLPDALFDVRGLEQVIVNLLINAAQAADKKDSWIRIKAKVNGEATPLYVIEISDNGCGMEEKIISKIFDPFYTTKPPDIGTGLGLYVCYNLIEKMGGRIEVMSHAGIGSTFSICLPCKLT
jgi:signal transduction histidine kinase/CheY-like chemotaxis protein